MAILLGLIVHFLLRKVHLELGKDDDGVNAKKIVVFCAMMKVMKNING